MPDISRDCYLNCNGAMHLTGCQALFGIDLHGFFSFHRFMYVFSFFILHYYMCAFVLDLAYPN
jgi:hypothetical protein